MADITMENLDLATLRKLRLEDLPSELQAIVFKTAAKIKLSRETLAVAKVHGMDIQELIGRFLKHYRSTSTRRTYRRGIMAWMDYCWAKDLNPLLATPKDGDLFAAELAGSPATVNSAIDAVSSFSRTLVKWEAIERSPFIDVKRRKLNPVKHTIPTRDEIASITQAIRNADTRANPHTREIVILAVEAMAARGFRIGALAGLSVNGTTFTTMSKGKIWRGSLAAELAKALRGKPKPFEGCSMHTIATIFARTAKRLHASGSIAHPYSVHDLRHLFAVTEYAKDQDIARVSEALNHGTVNITIRYLHELGAA